MVLGYTLTVNPEDRRGEGDRKKAESQNVAAKVSSAGLMLSFLYFLNPFLPRAGDQVGCLGLRKIGL